VQCGPGTRLEGNQCLPIVTDGGTGTDGGSGGGGGGMTCGPGTHVEGNQCLPGDPIDQIEVSPASATTRVGGRATFTATAKYRGNAVAGVAFSWATASGATATIDSRGEATGVAVGSTEVRASARGVTSTPASLTVEPGPSFRMTTLEPSSGPGGTPITLTGSQFGLTQGATVVKFGATTAATVLSWSDTRIVVRAPYGVAPGQVNVTLENSVGSSNSLPFTFTNTPYVASVTPGSAVQGSQVTLLLSGSNLGTCSVAVNRNGAPDASFTVNNTTKVVERFGAPGLPDLVRVNVDVGANTSIGEVAVSCGSSSTAVNPDNRFTVAYRVGTITASVGTGVAGFEGDGNAARLARLAGPTALAMGGSGELYIADTGNHRLRVANLSSGTLTVAGLTVPAGAIVTLAGGAGQAGNVDPGYSGDGGPATASQLNEPRGLAYDKRGLLFVADTGNHCIRAINVSATSIGLPGGTVAPGAIVRVAGTGGQPGYFGDGQQALPDSRFNGPVGLAIDDSGLLYVADTANHRLRVIHTGLSATTNGLGTFTPGSLSLVAGSSVGAAGDNARVGTGTQFNALAGLALASNGLLYVSDMGNNKIRVINTTASPIIFGGPSAAPAGLGTEVASAFITTAVGEGGAGGYAGEGWCGTTFLSNASGLYYFNVSCLPTVKLSSPAALAAAPFGQLFIADANNNRVRLAGLGDAPVHRAGKWFHALSVDVLAGNGQAVAGPGGGDMGLAHQADLFDPRGIAWSESEGALYIADTLHNRVRRVLVDAQHDPFSGELGAWPADLTSGSATLNVDTGILSYTTPNGPAERRYGATGGVFSFSGPLRIFSGVTLTLTGSRPAVLAATGNIHIEGKVRVQSGGLTAGPGHSGGGGMSHSTHTGARGGYDCGSSYRVWYAGYKYGNETLVPITPGTGGSNIGGGLVLSAGKPGVSANIQVTGELRADSTDAANCAPPGGGSGGGLRLVATGQLSVTGTLTARPGISASQGPSGAPCCNSSWGPATLGDLGRIRLQAPTVISSGTVDPAPSIATTPPTPLPWM
jgi:sugar lactone lactonase YvrE